MAEGSYPQTSTTFPERETIIASDPTHVVSACESNASVVSFMECDWAIAIVLIALTVRISCGCGWLHLCCRAGLLRLPSPLLAFPSLTSPSQFPFPFPCPFAASLDSSSAIEGCTGFLRALVLGPVRGVLVFVAPAFPRLLLSAAFFVSNRLVPGAWCRLRQYGVHHGHVFQ